MYRVFYRSRTRSTTLPAKSILSRSGHSLPSSIGRTESKTEFEITSIIIRQFIEKKKFDKAVDTLRGLSAAHILKCLESFPFSVLNHSVPNSFPIWETLLVKLHNSEDGHCIARVPNSACHQLVNRISTILAYLEQHQDPDLYFQCRRVLKKVYMHYPDITEYLRKCNEQLSKSLYTLTLHIPLGTDSSATSLQQAIQDEVTASLIDLKDAIEHLEELPLQFSPQKQRKNGWHHTLTQRQIQERLYFNQCILHSVSPCRRKDNLSQLREMLESRIQGDKDVLTLFANLRQDHDGLTDNEPVEPKLRHQRHSIECALAVLQGIQNELSINSPQSSPVATDRDSPDIHYPLVTARSLDHNQFTTVALQDMASCRSSSEKHLIRPVSVSIDRATSDHDISLPPTTTTTVLATTTGTGTTGTGTTGTGSGKRSSKGGLLRRSLRNSMKRLSSSAGNVSSNNRSKQYNKTEDDDELAIKTKELLEAREQIASLRRRERELTDRLSEQAQRHLEGSEHFEDILMGANRPSLVVQRFQEIYSQERIEAYDSIADIEGTDEELFIPTFLLDVLKYCYRAAQCSLESLHNGWKRSLHVRGEGMDDREIHAIKQLETAVSVFIRKVTCSYEDIQSITTMAYYDLEKSYGGLPFYQSIISTIHVQTYIDECALLSWELVIQNPPMVIKDTEIEYSPELHTRFHSANATSDTVLCYQWPTLVHETSGMVLLKGIVVT